MKKYDSLTAIVKKFEILEQNISKHKQTYNTSLKNYAVKSEQLAKAYHEAVFVKNSDQLCDIVEGPNMTHDYWYYKSLGIQRVDRLYFHSSSKYFDNLSIHTMVKLDRNTLFKYRTSRYESVDKQELNNIASSETKLIKFLGVCPCTQEDEGNAYQGIISAAKYISSLGNVVEIYPHDDSCPETVFTPVGSYEPTNGSAAKHRKEGLI